VLAIEALVVRSMVKHPHLAKSIADASWSMFFTRRAALKRKTLGGRWCE
jgi:putative transposase